MQKKIALSLALILFINLIISPLNSQAAVAGKAVNQAAKKVAKEIVADQAVQMSMNLVLDPKYRFTPTESTPQAKQGYTMVCMPRDKKSDGTCTAPVEVKQNLTPDDKKAIAARAEINLDKKITGGIGQTRWGKFIDWFVPTFAVGSVVAVMGAAFSGELGSFFDDLALESLSDNGLVANMEVSATSLIKASLSYQTNVPHTVYLYVRSNTDKDISLVDSKGNKYGLYGTESYQMGFKLYPIWDNTTQLEIDGFEYGSYGLDLERAKGIRFNKQSESRTYSEAAALSFLSQIGFRVKTHGQTDNTSLPKFDETGLSPTTPPNTQRQVVAPGAIPFTKTDTGEVLIPYLKPDGTVGFKTGTGTIVPEDNVTVGNPSITYNPDGSTTVGKAPKPNGTTDPDEEETIPPEKPPEDNEDPETPENACTDKIRLPKLKPLFTTISTAFPFSLPFDLYRGFNAFFADIGKEKPKIEFEFFKGPKINITIPKVFDDFMPFIRTLMIFTFDVGLLYAIYRLIRV